MPDDSSSLLLAVLFLAYVWWAQGQQRIAPGEIFGRPFAVQSAIVVPTC